MAEYKKNPAQFKKDGFKPEKIEEQFVKVSESFVKLIEILDRNSGPFVMGPNLSLADFAYFFTWYEGVNRLRASIEKHLEVKEWYNKVLNKIEDLDGMDKVFEEYNN